MLSEQFEIKELTIVLLAETHNPTILNPDFLKYNEIVPFDWKVAGSPVAVHSRLWAPGNAHGSGKESQPTPMNFEAYSSRSPSSPNLPKRAIELGDSKPDITHL